MNKFLLAWIVIFIVWFGGSFVVHGVLLHDDSAKLQTTGLFRREAESQQFSPLMILAHVMLSGAVVAKQIIFDGILTLFLASITAFIYQQPAQA